MSCFLAASILNLSDINQIIEEVQGHRALGKWSIIGMSSNFSGRLSLTVFQQTTNVSSAKLSVVTLLTA